MTLLRFIFAGVVLSCFCRAVPSAALDKQGSAHGGAVSDDSDPGVTASVMVGSALYNPSYAARPDNSGLALMRYASHVDIDIIGPKLSIPLDINVFSDFRRGGAKAFLPTEFDFIGGLSTQWAVGHVGLELGVRLENDRPVDRGNYQQTYGDVRARLLWSAVPFFPDLAKRLNGGDLHGWLTVGWFGYNKTYAARPDNSGLALLRYALHAEATGNDEKIGFGVDAVMFTDRQVQALRPSELDVTFDVKYVVGDWDLHVAYERDMPVDRAGLVQQMVFVTGGRSWAWDPAPRTKTVEPWK